MDSRLIKIIEDVVWSVSSMQWPALHQPAPGIVDAVLNDKRIGVYLGQYK